MEFHVDKTMAVMYLSMMEILYEQSNESTFFEICNRLIRSINIAHATVSGAIVHTTIAQSREHKHLSRSANSDWI